MTKLLDIVEDNVRFSYIVAAALVIEAGFGLFHDKLSGGEFVQFTGIIAGAYGIVGIANAVSNIVKAKHSGDSP